MEENADSIDSEEFEGWLKPADVWAAYGLGSITGIHELQRRLVAGIIGSTCGKAVGRGVEYEHVRLPASMWAKIPHPMSEFWLYGSLDARDSDGDLVLFDVRFEPPTIESDIAPNDEITERNPIDDKPKVRLPRIKPDEAKRFSQLYIAIWNDDAKEIPALNAARSCYPANSVPKEYFLGIFREMRGAGKRGNPQFTKKT